MQDHAADQLNIEMAHAKNAFRSFATDREGFREQIVQRFAAFDARPEFDGLGLKRGIIKFSQARLDGVDPADPAAIGFQGAIVGSAEKRAGDT
ncbi:hypothetical protein AA700_1727 [Acidiphilium acidophilum DSM 700]|nr:hypothetical protein AA700_1727 [Acidiphilium acidophilum DSM 700]